MHFFSLLLFFFFFCPSPNFFLIRAVIRIYLFIFLPLSCFHYHKKCLIRNNSDNVLVMFSHFRLSHQVFSKATKNFKSGSNVTFFPTEPFPLP